MLGCRFPALSIHNLAAGRISHVPIGAQLLIMMYSNGQTLQAGHVVLCLCASSRVHCSFRHRWAEQQLHSSSCKGAALAQRQAFIHQRPCRAYCPKAELCMGPRVCCTAAVHSCGEAAVPAASIAAEASSPWSGWCLIIALISTSIDVLCQG